MLRLAVAKGGPLPGWAVPPSHTRQFVISFITNVTIHYSFSLPLQAQNSSFPQILSSIVFLTFLPSD